MSNLGRMRVSKRDLSHVLQCVAKCRALEKPGSSFANWAITFTERLRKFLGGGKAIGELEWELENEGNVPGSPKPDDRR